MSYKHTEKFQKQLASVARFAHPITAIYIDLTPSKVAQLIPKFMSSI